MINLLSLLLLYIISIIIYYLWFSIYYYLWLLISNSLTSYQATWRATWRATCGLRRALCSIRSWSYSIRSWSNQPSTISLISLPRHMVARTFVRSYAVVPEWSPSADQIRSPVVHEHWNNNNNDHIDNNNSNYIDNSNNINLVIQFGDTIWKYPFTIDFLI